MGDWNGIGGGKPNKKSVPPTATVRLYNPSKGTFSVKNRNGNLELKKWFRFGPKGSNVLPVAGDWNGNGRDTVGVYVDARVRSKRRFLLAGKNVTNGGKQTRVVSVGRWAGRGWRPFIGEWDADGFDDLGLFDPAKCVFYPAKKNGKKLTGQSVKYESPILPVGLTRL